MAQLISVKLSRFDGSPWGFRLQGGKDFGTPLIVQKVNNGSPAEAAGLRAGDAVIKVNNTEMFNLRHKDAQDVIVRSGNNFEMTVQRGGSTWRPSVSPVTPSIPSPQPHLSSSNISPVTKTSLAAKKQEGPLIGSGHNFSPKPFLNGTSDSGPIKSIVNKQYNSPVGIYSEQTIAETLSAQAEVLAGGVLGVNFKKNEKNYDAGNSEVFKMVQEADKEPKTPEPAETVPSSGVVTPSSPALAGLRSVSAPETKVPQPTTPQTNLPPGQNICAECERLIVGVFVRIKEKNLHVECFKCSTCGTSLKNVGYYNINNKLYCDIHAKLVARQQAPAGYVPITVPPGGKAPAGTISAALGNLPLSSPKPAPVNGTCTPSQFSTIPQRPNSDLGRVARGYSRPSEFTPTNGHRNCIDKDYLDEKTYTSTITIRTGSEVGSDDCLDNNQNETNKKYVVTSLLTPSTINDENKSPPMVFDPVITDEKIEKAIVGTCAIARYPVTNQRTRSPAFTSPHPTQTDKISQLNGLNKLINRDTTDYTKTDIENHNVHLDNHKLKFGQVISALTNGHDSKINGSSTKYTNGTSGINNKTLSKDNNRLQTKNEINHATPTNFCSSSSSLASFLLAHRTTHPETLPTSPTTTPDSSSSSISSSPTPPATTTTTTTRNNQFGIQPNDTPSYASIQTPTSNFGGPKPFGTSSIPPPSFSTPSAPTPVINNNSSRPQNQTITANGDLTNSIINGQSLKPTCCCCDTEITRGPFITALGQIWCPEHFVCVNPQCRRHLQDIGFVEEKGQLYCEYCFERFIAPPCNKCNQKIKGDCLNAIGKHYHPECFNCAYCGKLFGNSPFFLEEGLPYCEADWNELFTTKCFACGFPVEAGDRWVEALNNNYHSQCFNCTMCKKNLEGQSFYAKGGRPFCKNHAR